MLYVEVDVEIISTDNNEPEMVIPLNLSSNRVYLKPVVPVR